MSSQTFQEKLAAKRARDAELAAATAPPVVEGRAQDADLVPDEDSGYQRSDDELTIDSIIQGIDILDAYRRWIGKKIAPHRSGKKEGIHVSCPQPSHPDNNPSAWVNTEKKTWYCPGCDIGGDVIDLAAIHFGMFDYKSGKNFGEIRRRIAEDYGYTFVTAPGLPEPILVAPAPEASEPTAEVVPLPSTAATPEPAPAAAPVPPPVAVPAPAPAAPDAGTAPSLSVVMALPVEEEDDNEEYDLPGLDWREIVTPDTFLDVYMRQTTIDDVPEEYHFWLGLLALGMAIGRDVTLQDRRPVMGNLFLCILGKTGTGKSRATEHANRLTQMALPWSSTDPMSRGVKQMNTPSSGENMIQQFYHPIADPHNAKAILGYSSIRGIVDYNELSGLIGRGSRVGSTVKSTLMDFFDAKKTITSASVTNGAFRAENSFCSVLTTTQPKALRGLLDQSDIDSGFLNRWLFVTGTMKEREAFGGTEIDLRPAIQPLVDIHEWADGGRMVKWSNNEAKAEYTRLFVNRLNPAELSDDPLLARVNLLCKKLVLLLSANEMREEVTLEIVQKVEKLYDYILAVFGVPQAEMGRTDTKEIEDKILKVIRDWEKKNPKSGGCPMHQITKYFQSKRFERSMVEKALKILTSLNLVQAYAPEPTPGKTGRPAGPRYKVVGE